MTSVNAAIVLEVINCWSCGCVFAMAAELKNEMKAQQKNIFCPRGCQLSLGEPAFKQEMDRLKRDNTYLQGRLSDTKEVVNRLNRRVTALKGVVTRHKRVVDFIKDDNSEAE